MLKVIYYIKSEKLPNGENPIYAKISSDEESITVSTGKSILKERWNFTNNLRNALKLEKEKVLKQSLNLFKLQVEKKCIDLFNLDQEVSLSELKKQLKGKNTKVNSKSVGILEVFDKHNLFFKRKVMNGERSKASLQKYMRSKELIMLFIKKHYSCADYPISDITSSFIYNLENFLKYESSFKGKIGIKNNSVVKYFRNFGTVCNYCIKMEIIDKNPFGNYDGKLLVKEATFLSQQELDMIENKIFNTDRLNRVKDIFLFSCYTGYAPIDASNLTEENLLKDGAGYW